MTTPANPFNWRQQPSEIDITEIRRTSQRHKVMPETGSSPYYRLIPQKGLH